jgi:hypothetical protein
VGSPVCGTHRKARRPEQTKTLARQRLCYSGNRTQAAAGHICCVDKTMHETLSCPFALCNTPCMLRVPCIALTLSPPQGPLA